MKAPILFGTVLMMLATAASAKSAQVAKKKDVPTVPSARTHVGAKVAHAARAVRLVAPKDIAHQVEEALQLRQALTHAEPVPALLVTSEAHIAPVVAAVPTKELQAKEVKEAKESTEVASTSDAKISPLHSALKPLPAPGLVRVSATTKEVLLAVTPVAAEMGSANKATAVALSSKCVTRYSVSFTGQSTVVPVNVCGDKLGKITQKLLRAESAQGRPLDAALALRLSQLLPAEKAAHKGAAVRFDVLADTKSEREKTAHSDGRAVDIKPVGVSLKQLADACKKLDDTGCGAYPEGGFLHVDLREAGAGNVSWVDASRPGEAPKYVAEWPKNR